MKISLTRNEMLLLLLLLVVSGGLLWENSSLRAERNAVRELVHALGDLDFTAEECRERGVELQSKERTTALLYLLFAAHKGDAWGQNLMGRFMDEEVFAADAAQKERWYLAAAEQGDPELQHCLADWYRGRGAYCEPEMAAKMFRWEREAALQGHPAAMRWLAYSYLKGIGCEKDAAAAEEWYKKVLARRDEETVSWHDVSDCYVGLAEVYVRTGRREQGYKMLRAQSAQGNQYATLLHNTLVQEEGK